MQSTGKHFSSRVCGMIFWVLPPKLLRVLQAFKRPLHGIFLDLVAVGMNDFLFPRTQGCVGLEKRTPSPLGNGLVGNVLVRGLAIESRLLSAFQGVLSVGSL